MENGEWGMGSENLKVARFFSFTEEGKGLQPRCLWAT
jgi:hypothetical protein